MQRREFLQLLAVAASAGWSPFSAASEENLYEVKPFGEVRLLHTTDTHAQLLPLYYREPDANLGLGPFRGKPPHLVGRHLLQKLKLAADSRLAHLLTPVNFNELARRYGKVGGFAHLASLCRRLRQEYGKEKTLHLDGGDLWQGSATALYTQGRDMVTAANLLGIDIMVGHWEFTYPEAVLRANIADFQGDFIAQNVLVREESLFNGAIAHDEETGHVFPPHVIKTVGTRRIAVIGQAFPYTPIANPQRFIPDWTFGIRADELQARVDRLRQQADAVILLSHNGADLDATLARDIRGIDFILGGHTHDIFHSERVINGTVVVNSGCVGKTLGCLDIAFTGGGQIADYRWRILPVFADLLPADAAMQSHIDRTRAPYEADLAKTLATTDTLLYRRGNFNGTLDQLIVDALRAVHDSAIAFSPGFRWGASILPGPIRLEDLMNATAITYPETYRREMTGDDIKNILESVADNLYHPNPYYRQGGDMVRSGGLRYTLRPAATLGRRIDNLRLPNGDPIQADKRYTVAGWATAQPSPAAPIWEIVSDYLRQQKTVAPRPDLPALSGVADNPGIDGYPSELLL